MYLLENQTNGRREWNFTRSIIWALRNPSSELRDTEFQASDSDIIFIHMWNSYVSLVTSPSNITYSKKSYRKTHLLDKNGLSILV